MKKEKPRSASPGDLELSAEEGSAAEKSSPSAQAKTSHSDKSINAARTKHKNLENLIECLRLNVKPDILNTSLLLTFERDDFCFVERDHYSRDKYKLNDDPRKSLSERAGKKRADPEFGSAYSEHYKAGKPPDRSAGEHTDDKADINRYDAAVFDKLVKQSGDKRVSCQLESH